MPNLDISPKSIKPVVPPPPRSWQRTTFFALNCTLALLLAYWWWFAFAISRDVLTLSVAIVVTIYCGCEGVGLFNRSLALERGLGFADIAVGLGLSVLAAANITQLNPSDSGPGFIVFVLAFVTIFVCFVVYLFVCGFLRLKWTGKSKAA